MILQLGEGIVRVNVPGPDALLSQVSRRLADGEGFAVATLNLDHIVKLRTDPDFVRAYSRHELVVADGRPISWLARLGGASLDVAPGSDTIVPLCRAARDAGASVALVGSAPEVLERSADELRRAVPGLNICLCIAPTRGFIPDGAEARDILGQLNETGARLCFLALGAIKQERFAVFARDVVPNIGFVSIGAGLDFIAGHQVRAPKWMRGLGLEWLWRTIANPRRMVPRYLACFRILPGLAFSAFMDRVRAARL